jgi:hypothetical protein
MKVGLSDDTLAGDHCAADVKVRKYRTTWFIRFGCPMKSKDFLTLGAQLVEILCVRNEESVSGSALGGFGDNNALAKAQAETDIAPECIDSKLLIAI